MNLFVCGMRRSGTTILYDALREDPSCTASTSRCARTPRRSAAAAAPATPTRSPRPASCASAFARAPPRAADRALQLGRAARPGARARAGAARRTCSELLADAARSGARRGDQGDAPSPQARRGRRARPRGGGRPPGPRPARRHRLDDARAGAGGPTSIPTPTPSSPPAPGGALWSSRRISEELIERQRSLDLPADIPDFLRPLLVWKAAFESTAGDGAAAVRRPLRAASGSRTCAPTRVASSAGSTRLLGATLPEPVAEWAADNIRREATVHLADDPRWARGGRGCSGWSRRSSAPATPRSSSSSRRRASRSTSVRRRRGRASRASSAGPAGAAADATLRIGEGSRADPAEGGHPRPAGQGRRAGAAGARLRGRQRTSGSAGWSSSRHEDGADLDRLCEKLLANPLIEDYEIERMPTAPLRVRGCRGRSSADVRRPPVPRLVRRARRGARLRAGRRGAAGLARRRPTSPASTRSSSPAASPTATTCGSARSPASRR